MATALLYIVSNTSALAIPVFAVAVSFILIYAVVRCGYYLGGAVSILSFVSACFFSFNIACVVAAAVLPVVYAAGYVIRGKKRLRDSILISSGAVLAGGVLAIGVLQLITGLGVVDFSVESVGSALKLLGDDDIKMFYQTVRYADILTGTMTQEAVAATPAAEAVVIMMDMVREALDLMIVSIMLIYSLIAGFLCYTVPRNAAKKHGIQVAAIPAFKDYALPKRFWLAYLISYVFAVIGVSYGWQSFDALEITIDYVFAFVFIVQGLSFLDFLYHTRKMGTGTRTVLHILAALILSSIIVWVGLFENIVGMRKRMDAKGGIAG